MPKIVIPVYLQFQAVLLTVIVYGENILRSLEQQADYGNACLNYFLTKNTTHGLHNYSAHGYAEFYRKSPS